MKTDNTPLPMWSPKGLSIRIVLTPDAPNDWRERRQGHKTHHLSATLSVVRRFWCSPSWTVLLVRQNGRYIELSVTWVR